MGGKPKVVKQDPEGDALRAANKATAEANAKRASRRSANSTGSASSVLSPTGDRGKFYAIIYPLAIWFGQISSYYFA